MNSSDRQVKQFDSKWIRQKIAVPIIAVYKRPADYPSLWVARLWDGETVTPIVSVAETLEELREAKPPEMVILPRTPEDDPVIYETWV